MTIDPLFIDTYAGDLGGRQNLSKLIAAGPPWHGIGLKATEGTRYDGGAWFREKWGQARELAGDRYGLDWWRYAYHYWHADADPMVQADNFCQTVDLAGGWDVGDLWPMIDVERAGQPSGTTTRQVIDGVSACAARIRELTGCSPTLYGGSYLADLGVRDHMGCARLAVARYTATLPTIVEQRIGWKLTDVLWWQYDGDGESHLAGYPQISPMGRLDISATLIAGGGAAALSHLRQNTPFGGP